MFTELQIQKFALINEKIRAEEIKARAYLIKLWCALDLQVKDGVLDDYEIETCFSVYSYHERFCQTKGVEVGDPFYETDLYSLHPYDEDSFNLNSYINAWSGLQQLKDFHFGDLMHGLFDHTPLQFEDILAIDDVWIEIIVRHQFWTDKTHNQNEN